MESQSACVVGAYERAGTCVSMRCCVETGITV